MPDNTPQERLAGSRALLRQALGVPVQPSTAMAGTGSGAATNAGGLASALARAAGVAGPGASPGTGLSPGQAAASWLRPLAQRHPIALVLGAGLLGAGLVLARPWRWRKAPGWIAPLAAMLGGAAPPWWLTLGLAVLAEARRRPVTANTPTPAPGPPSRAAPAAGAANPPG